MSDLHIRLREMREEKGYSQELWASLVNVTRQSQTNYESGLRVPDAAYLEKAANVIGVDIAYLITGQKFLNTPRNNAQLNMLNAMNEMDEADQTLLYEIARTMVKHKASKAKP